MTKHTLFQSLLIIASTVCFVEKATAQQLEPTVEEMTQKFPGEKAVILNNKEHVVITTKADTFTVLSNNYEEILYLSDLASMYSNKSVSYNSFSEIQNLSAQTFIPKGEPGKYTAIKVKDFTTSHVSSDGIFYDDRQEIGFSYPSIQKGAKTILSYSQLYKDPKFLGGSYFISHIPVLNSEFKVAFPSNVEIGYKLFNTENVNVEFTQTVEGKNNVYTWKIKDILPFKSVEGAPDFTYYIPHIIVYIKQFKLKTKNVEVFPDVHGYYRWCYSLVKDINKEQDPKLKSIVDSLVKGESDPDIKAKKIFYWVQDNIKYVAFEDGMGGFIPRQAGAVCQKRYGDCKDMASIITEMLEYAGLPGYLTLIGARNLPYKYSDIATPSVDNHMIAAYKNKQNQMIFLDATGSYTPFGFPTSMIQGKESLIGIGKDDFEILTVPVIHKNKNTLLDKTVLQIKDNGIQGTGTIKATGFAKLNFVYNLLDKNDKKREETLQAILEKGSNKFLVESADFTGLADRDSAVNVKYKFSLNDYAQFNKNEIYINLHLEKKLSKYKLDIEKRRGVPLEFDYTFNDVHEVVLNVPEGYVVEYVPENVNYEGEKFGFKIQYIKNKNQLTMKIDLYGDLLLLQEPQFEAWNTMIKKLNMAYQESVILKKALKTGTK